MKKILILFFVPLIVFSQNAKEIAKKCMSSTVSLIMEDQYKQPLSLGSGFIVSNGKIVTNVHVIENANYGYVTISGETKKHNIEGYYAIDRANDLVLLSVPSLIGNTIEFSSAPVEIGEKIYAIGNPKGLSGTISEGIVSGIRTFEKDELIQITAAISPGSSGGPVINDDGKLIGVSVGTMESGQNLNFAIPTKYVSNMINSASNKLIKLNIKSTPKKTTTSSTKNIKDGIEIINIEWTDYGESLGKRLKGFSIKNNLQYVVNRIKLLIILKDSHNTPIDYIEIDPITYNLSINPYLSKYITTQYFEQERVCNRKKGEKLEIRIIDFSIKE